MRHSLFRVALAFIAVGCVVAVGIAQSSAKKNDFKREVLPDGHVRITTPAYVIEVPKGWEVGEQTSFGQREISKGSDTMSAMTGPGAGARGWDQLYKTSLFFIRKRETAKATPYKLMKTDQGYEACSFSIVEADGFTSSRYVIIKAKSNNILALSVKIPDRKREKDLSKEFTRMVQTAQVI